tara:strand:+ start:399 stop:620 length:222 start_codon:yes stop_codon:yes gene_type:complete
MQKEKLDLILNKWTSRKLLVFLISAVALFTGKLTGDSWVILATAYVGTEGIIDAVTRLKGVKMPTTKNEENNI